MSTEITAMEIKNSFAALSPQQQLEHREKIGVRAKTILSQFWASDSTPVVMQVLELEGWMDVLQECSHGEVSAAWALYNRAGPRTAAGKLYKPDAGYLWRLIEAARSEGWPVDNLQAFISETFSPDDADTARQRARYRTIISEAQAAASPVQQ